MKQKNTILQLVIVGLISFFAQSMKASWIDWWYTAKYKNPPALKDKKFTNLKINGGAILEDVQVSGDLEIDANAFTTAVKMDNVTVGKSTYIFGGTLWNGGEAKGKVIIDGNLAISYAEMKGEVFVSGHLASSNVSFSRNVMLERGIEAKYSTFKDIIVTVPETAQASEYVQLLKLRKSKIDDLLVKGSGDRIVILDDTNVDAIVFTQEGGIVKLLGSSAVRSVINGTINKAKIIE